MLKMTKTNFYLRPLVLASAIAFMISSPFCLAAQTKIDSLKSLTLEWKNRQPQDFSGDGRPKRTAGGASRSQCQAKNDLPLTAIVPDTAVVLTAARSPTFWFYLPYTLTPQHSVEFVLKDDRNKYVYKTELTGKKVSPGIIDLRLPSEVTLNPELSYDWYFVVYCQPQNRDKFVYVNGSVRRIKSSYLNSSSKLSSPQKQLDFYASKGLWYDLVTHLAKLTSANPHDSSIKDNWATLLRSVGLEKLAGKPFSCCSFNSEQ